MRRHLSWLVAAWLICQAAALAAAPFAMRSSAAATGGGPVVCSCPGAKPGQACPMHHPDHAKPPDGGFLLQNPCSPSPAAMLFLAGGLGLPSLVHVTVDLTLAAGDPPLPLALIISRSDIPDSPPPRLERTSVPSVRN